jgi:radical SAM protein with 4Fe4S-binding SPASM domain
MSNPNLDSDWFVRTIPRRPTNLLWEITDACNLRCLHCEGAAGKKNPSELSHDEIMDLCAQIVAMKWRRVSITGGEPLLRTEWAEIARTLRAGGVSVALITNGLQFDAEAAARAREAGVETVAVSLDGLRQTHDRIRVRPTGRERISSFDAALAALDHAAQAGMKSAAITHVNLWNFPELRDLYLILRDRRVFGWQIQLGVPLGRLREIDEPYLLPVEQLPALEAFCASLIETNRSKQEPPAISVMHSIGYYGKNEMTLRGGIKKKPAFFVGCVGGWRTLGITSDGRVKPCAMLPRKFAVGDLRKEKLSAIWDDRDRFDYQSKWDEKKLEGLCRGCNYRCICRAGCTAMAYALTGSIYNNPFCIYGQAHKEPKR